MVRARKMMVTRILYKTLLFLILSLVLNTSGEAQAKDIAALNNYINFTNESIHGMLIVHRLLENFNQEVNKFVNLESHQINFYSNKDLPKNIFDDPEHWFYERSPKEWYRICTNQGLFFQENWNNLFNTEADSMHVIINKINELRFDAEKIIENKDLTQRSNQEIIYKKLEEGVSLFESFYLHQKKLMSHIQGYVTKSDVLKITDDIHTIHAQVHELLEGLRYKDDNKWAEKLKQLIDNLNSSDVSESVSPKLDQFISDGKRFIETAEVYPGYKLYGKYYYYHNSLLLNQVNRYGNGYVNEYNISIIPTEKIKLFEVPHFYKVLYPVKWVENEPIASTDPSIEALPSKLKERNITVSDRTIYVDDYVVDLELFDHKMVDGDIISVNYNGDWIIEKQTLEAKPIKIKVRLNEEGKNFLLLHAENLGKRPPNTMALRYTYKGKTETVVLSSDLNESETIELKVSEE